MRKFENSFIVENDIETVWRFYTDIKHLEVITPKIMGLQILKSDHQIIQEGTNVWLSAKLIFKFAWHSKITYLKYYEYVDEMIKGRFKIWKHLHKFNKIDENKTQVNDIVYFELPYGWIGKLFDNYTTNNLKNIFAYRESATKEYLKSNSTNPIR